MLVAFVTGGAQAARLRAATGICLSVILIAASALLLWATFRDGVAHGRDAQLSPFGAGHFVNAVCAILSAEKYRTGRYVCASAAQNGMNAAGLDFDDLTLSRIHMSLSGWLQNAVFLNSALKAAFAAPSLPWNGWVTPIGWGADAGFQDFVQFGFLVFGERIQALYNGFFLLLTLSSTLFAAQFYKRIFALFVLTAALYAIYDFFHSFLTVFNPGLNNPRTLTFIAVVPLLHAMFLILYGERRSARALLLFIPQAALIAAAGDFVDLSYWTVIAISVLSVLVIGNSWGRLGEPFGRCCRRCWPTAAVIGCVALALIATAIAADPRLAKNGGMRMHSFWEPLFYDLQIGPEWRQKYAGQFHNATGDTTATVAVEVYLAQHPIPDDSPDYVRHEKMHGLTQVAFEKYTRLSYLQFASDHPGYILRLKLFDLQTVLNTLGPSVLRGLRHIDWRFVLLEVGVALATIFDARKNPRVFLLVTSTAASLLLFVVVATAPDWIIVPEIEVMGGPFVIALLASVVAVFWVVVALGLAILKAMSGRRLSAAL